MPTTYRKHAKKPGILFPSLPDLLTTTAAHSVERDDRSWLLPYIDLFTLLLTVFVVLLTYAEVFPGSHDSLRTSLPAANSTPVKEAQHSIEPPSDTPQIGEQIAPTPSQENLIGQQFQKLISDQGLEDLVDVNVEESRVNLQIKDSILFPLGEAGLTSPGTKVLSEIVKVLQDNPYRLSIVGHTDPLPIRTTRFPSNWELSTARASTVLRYLNGQGVKLERMRAVGYADTIPLRSNDTPEGRAANRRVSLVLNMGEQNWAEEP